MFQPIRITLLMALLAACASTGAQQEVLTDQGDPAPASPKVRQLAQVQTQLDAEDWHGARAALIPLLVAAAMEEGQAALDAGRPRDAFRPIEAALALDPDAADLHFLRAQVAMASAAGDTQPVFFYEDAAESFESAFRSGLAAKEGKLGAQEISCLVGISQAKRLALDPDMALTLARNAGKALAQIEGPVPKLSPPLSRVWAEAGFDAYLAARKSEAPSDALFAETEDQLFITSADPEHRQWALVQLSNLQQWQNGVAAAIAPIERALEFAPEDAGLHARLVSLLESSGGRVALLEHYSAWSANHPDSAIGWWYQAVTLFQQGLEQFESGAGDASTFLEAETLFDRYGKLAPESISTSQAYQASCRSARGFIQLNAGNLDAAEEAFLSMQDLFPGAIEVATGERIPSGLVGLDFVIGKHAQKPEELSAMRAAARVANYLHEYRPTSADYANNAGFFNRDAAVLLEQKAQEAAKNKAEEESKEIFAEALLVMEQSWQAYQTAAELAPTDVRMVNDAGLVMTYYLRQDVEVARVLLEQARKAGDLALGELTAEERAQQEWADPIEAWGDAYQNLGILHLTLLDDPAGSKPYFERALEIGPPRRAWLKTDMLPLVDRLIAGEDLPPEEYAFMVWLHQSPAR